MSNEERPAQVPATAKQAGEAMSEKWAWVERSIWTERMLETLEKGVKGGVWFSLVDKVYRDGWLRRRLRSILRKRSKRRGISRGLDHQRWPNAYFRERGLFSLETAHRALFQP